MNCVWKWPLHPKLGSFFKDFQSRIWQNHLLVKALQTNVLILTFSISTFTLRKNIPSLNIMNYQYPIHVHWSYNWRSLVMTLTAAAVTRHVEPGKQQRYCGWSWEGSGQGRGSKRSSGNSIYIMSWTLHYALHLHMFVPANVDSYFLQCNN